jgi:hypothetical protein
MVLGYGIIAVPTGIFSFELAAPPARQPHALVPAALSLTTTETPRTANTAANLCPPPLKLSEEDLRHFVTSQLFFDS